MAEISWLEKWFESHSPQLSGARISYSCFVKRTETDNPASTFHLETDNWLANLSLWESGACDFEAFVTNESHPKAINEYRQIESEEDLDIFLSQMLKLLQ